MSRRAAHPRRDRGRRAHCFGEYSAPRGHLTITAPVVFGRLHSSPSCSTFSRPILTSAHGWRWPIRSSTWSTIRSMSRSDRTAARQQHDCNTAGGVGWVTCASPQYLEARGTPQTPAELDQHDCIMFEGIYSNNLWSFRRGKETMARPIRPTPHRQYGRCRYRGGHRRRRRYPRPVLSSQTRSPR